MRTAQRTGFVLLALAIAACAREHHPGHPNFLLIITDDQSWVHAGYTGEPGIRTPNIDRIARHGIVFSLAYAASPSCTASRSALLSGQHAWRTGHGSTLWGEFPAMLETYQLTLERAGYDVGFTGKGWGPGVNRSPLPDPAGRPYQVRTSSNPRNISNFDYYAGLRKFLETRSSSKPFSFWLGFFEPHRPFDRGAGARQGILPGAIRVPGFLEDEALVRNDLADYFYEIEWLDNEVGRIIRLLEEFDELDNTVIVFTSDNGMPFPRAKSNNYEYGVRVPLTVMFRGNNQGLTINTPVSLTDLAPTFLSLAGTAPPTAMTGRSLHQLVTGERSQLDEYRESIAFSAFDRHIESAREHGDGYPVRAIHSGRFSYIHNFNPNGYPAGEPPLFSDIDSQSPTKAFMFGSEAAAARFPNRLAVDKRPAEELYDVLNDPFQLRNLADDPEYREVRSTLKARLFEELEQTGDPVLKDGVQIYRSHPYHEPR